MEQQAEEIKYNFSMVILNLSSSYGSFHKISNHSTPFAGFTIERFWLVLQKTSLLLHARETCSPSAAAPNHVDCSVPPSAAVDHASPRPLLFCPTSLLRFRSANYFSVEIDHERVEANLEQVRGADVSRVAMNFSCNV
eukprot:c24801_g1_i1 orf=316-729(+)